MEAQRVLTQVRLVCRRAGAMHAGQPTGVPDIGEEESGGLTLRRSKLALT